MERNNFEVVVPCIYNPYLAGCIDSILRQDYPYFTVHVVIDPTTPPRPAFFDFQATRKVEITFNPSRFFSLRNTLTACMTLSKDSIVVLVDGDDFLHDGGVLSKINEIYEKYSPFLTYGGTVPGYEKEYTITDTAAYRKSSEWTHHLTTFRRWLLDHINQNDLKDLNGNFYITSCDRALLYPMIEMAGEKNLYHTKFPCYIYNNENPENEWRIRKDQQDAACAEIKSKNEYLPL